MAVSALVIILLFAVHEALVTLNHKHIFTVKCYSMGIKVIIIIIRIIIIITKTTIMAIVLPWHGKG